MRKAFVKGTLAAMGVGLLAVSAQAADVKIYPSGDMDDGTGVFNIANEAYDKTSGVGITNGGNIMLITNKNNQPASLEIYMSNGQMTNATGSYNLAVWDDAAGNGDGVVDTGELTTVVDDAAATVTGTVSNGVLTFSPGANYLDIPAKSKLVIVDTGGAVGFNWQVDPGLAADSTVKVTVVESKGAPTEDATTTGFAQLINQYVFCPVDDWNEYSGYFRARTDLGADPVSSRFKNGWFDATSETEASQSFNLLDRNTYPTKANGCDSQDYQGTFIETASIGTGAIDTIKFTLKAINDQISKVTDGTDELTYSNGGWTQDVAATGATYAFTVNGTESITLRDFSMDIVSVPTSSDYNTITYASDVKAGEWDSEGYVGRIPYMIFGYEGYSCFMKVNNMHSTTEAEISVTAQVANQTDGTDEVVTASLGTVAPKTLKHISKDDIATALGLDAGKQYHVSLKVSVSAPWDSIDVAAFQSSPTGRTDIPVYIINGTQQ